MKALVLYSSWSLSRCRLAIDLVVPENSFSTGTMPQRPRRHSTLSAVCT